jgi:putative FmdB family regulatory protein
MPIYEYAATAKGCDHCTGHFDVLQKSKEDPLTRCPQCGAEVARVISAALVCDGQRAHAERKQRREARFYPVSPRRNGVYEKTAGKGPKFISGD